MRTRRAVLSDAARIAEIHVHSWQHAYRGLMPDLLLDRLSIDDREKSRNAQLTQGERNTIVVIAGDIVVGWAAFGANRDADVSAMTAEVYGIYCDPGRWRSGAGRALWREAMHQLTAQGYADVTCWVLEGNGRATRFYEAMGGVLDSGTIKMYEAMDVRLPEVRYRFTLPGPPTAD